MATITNPRLPLSPAYDRVRLNQILKLLPVVYNPQQFGAVGDGVHDDTAAINSALLATTGTGGVVAFPPGNYLASQIVQPRLTILDGGTPGAVTLTQISGSNRDFILSENFATLTNSNLFAPTTPTVPYWFGLRNIRIDGNNAGNSSGRGVAYYGNAQMILGTVVIQDTAGDALYTESAAASALTFPGLEGGFFDTIFVYRPKGKGWLFRGPHDALITAYVCLLDEAGGYGFQSESTANYGGQIDRCDVLHVYTYDTNTTNRSGVNITAGFSGGLIYADATSCVIAADGVRVRQIDATLVGHRVNFDGLTVSGNNVQAMGITAAISAAANAGRTCVKWTGGSGYVGSIQLNGSASTAQTGLEDTGSVNRFEGLLITAFSATGGVALKASAAGFSAYTGTIIDCKTGWSYTRTTGRNRADLQIYTNAGQTSVTGSAPDVTERIDIHESGVQEAGTAVQVVSTNAVDMTITTVQTVTLAHTCLYTPAARNVQVSFTATVTDYKWDFFPMFVSADATNLTIKCKLGTASATGGSKGDVMASVRMGA